MATINMPINITDSKAVKSLWSSVKGLATEVKQYTTDTIVPAMSKGAGVTANTADKGLDWTLKHMNTGAGVVCSYIETKLDANPNIAKMLSPTTVLRAKAYAAVEKHENAPLVVVNMGDQQ